MEKTSYLMFIIWAVLAVAAFACAFFTTPLIVKLVNIVFGVDNIMILGAWLYGTLKEARAKKSQEPKEE